MRPQTIRKDRSDVPDVQQQLGLWYEHGRECAATDHHWVESEVQDFSSTMFPEMLTECSRCGLTLEEFHHRAARDEPFTTADIDAAVAQLSKANVPIDIAIGAHLDQLSKNRFNLEREPGETDDQLRARMVRETLRGQPGQVPAAYERTYEGVMVTPEENQKSQEAKCIKRFGSHEFNWRQEPMRRNRKCVRCGAPWEGPIP